MGRFINYAKGGASYFIGVGRPRLAGSEIQTSDIIISIGIGIERKDFAEDRDQVWKFVDLFFAVSAHL